MFRYLQCVEIELSFYKYIFLSYFLNNLLNPGSAPTNSTNVMSPDIESGQSLSMTCGFNFAQYQNPSGGILTPQVLWTPPASPPSVTSTSSISSTLTVQATPPTVPAYTCTSSFLPLSSAPPGQATNAPMWTYSAIFPSKTVLVPCEFKFLSILVL